jgi:sugar (glycoside-pentoside-hexuronide) transporter
MDKNYQVGKKQIFAYGMGNFASQLSWTMVSTYLAVFYTDTFGLSAGAVAVLFLVAKIWDGINDPMMGAIMERTHTKYGRFRPYIVIGAPLLVLFTILTFTVPSFGGTAKLVYAYITYIGLGMVYTMTNIPYSGLPAVMTRDSAKINRLSAANSMGMMLGMVILNLCTLPLVNYFEALKPKGGYQITASFFAILALPMFWICAKACKETVVVAKEDQKPLGQSLKEIAKDKNLLVIVIYTMFAMCGMMGRIGVAVYFYLYVANCAQYTTIFMMLPTIVGAILMPVTPRIMEKFGKKNTIFIGIAFQAVGLLMMVFGPYTNIPYLVVCHLVYSIGGIKEACGPTMLVDALDVMDDRTGVRPDGTVFSLVGLGNKIGSAVGSALGVAIIGWFGYTGAEEITAHVQRGIMIGVNVVPVVVFVLAAITMCFYKVDEKKLPEIRERLASRNKVA